MKKFLLVVLCLAVAPACKTQTEVQTVTGSGARNLNGQNGTGQPLGTDPFSSPGNGAVPAPISEPSVPQPSQTSSVPAEPDEMVGEPGTNMPEPVDFEEIRAEERRLATAELKAMTCYDRYVWNLVIHGLIDWRGSDAALASDATVFPSFTDNEYSDKKLFLFKGGLTLRISETGGGFGRTRFFIQISATDLGGILQRRTVYYRRDCTPVEARLEIAPANAGIGMGLGTFGGIGTPATVSVLKPECEQLQQTWDGLRTDARRAAWLADTDRARKMSLCQELMRPVFNGGFPGGSAGSGSGTDAGSGSTTRIGARF